MDNTYTKTKTSLNMDKKLKNQIEFIGKLQHRDVSGQINHVVQRYVKKYIKKHNLEDNASITVEGKTFEEYIKERD